MILREKDKIEIIKLVKNSLSGQFRVLVLEVELMEKLTKQVILI